MTPISEEGWNRRQNIGADQLGNEYQNYEISGVEYDNIGETAGVDENTPAVAVEIPLNDIPGVYPKMFEEEFVDDANTNTAMPPLIPNIPPAEAASIQPILEYNTTPNIESE